VRARYEVRISPADVGERVTVRRRHDVPGEPPVADVIGYLRSWQDDVLRIERRDGEIVEVARADVLAARVVGPPPLPRPPRYTRPTDGDAQAKG
jgi:N-acetylglutamate synthase